MAPGPMRSRENDRWRLRSRVDEISAWGLTLYGALLPLHAIGNHGPRDITRFELGDALLVLAAPAVLVAMWRVRSRLLASPVVLAVAWLSGAYLLSAALDSHVSKARLIQSFLPIVAVGGVAAAVWSGKVQRVLRGLLAGGGVALAIAVIGYVVTLWRGPVLDGAFVFQSKHPILPEIPRITGTFGGHAVWLGEYCLVLLAIALGARDLAARRVRACLAGVTAVVLFGTFSFAWVGGLLLSGAWCLRAMPPARSRRFRSGMVLAFAMTYAAASWSLLVGMPVDTTALGGPQSCASLDLAHHVVRPTASPGLCVPISSDSPYPHRLTLYALAHRTALQSYREHPWFGLGRSGYRDFAVAYADRSVGPGAIGAYTAPIGVVASTLVHGGTVGALALVLLLFGVCRTGTSRLGPSHAHREGLPPAEGWPLYGVMALLVSATQTDFELRGPLWVLLGLLVSGIGRDGSAGPREAPASMAPARDDGAAGDEGPSTPTLRQHPASA